MKATDGAMRRCGPIRVAALLLVTLQFVAFSGCGGRIHVEQDETGGAGGAGGARPKTSGGAPVTSGGAPVTSGGAPVTSGGNGNIVESWGGGPSLPGACASTWPNPANADAQCKGIKTGGGCTLEGKSCPDLTCGLADSGRRACACEAGVWTCTVCDFTYSGFASRPRVLSACTAVAVDNVPCLEPCDVCLTPTEVCACYYDDEGALIWDCDKPPTSWSL